MSTLRQLEGRLISVMPVESTVDRNEHAHMIAKVVFGARRHAARATEGRIAATQDIIEATAGSVERLRESLWERRTWPETP